MDGADRSRHATRYRKISRKAVIAALKANRTCGVAAARALGISSAALRCRIRRMGLTTRPRTTLYSDAELLSLGLMFSAGVDAANHIGIHCETLRAEYAKRGLPWPFSTQEKASKIAEIGAETLGRMYRDAGYSWDKVAKALGCAVETIRKAAGIAGVPTVPGSGVYPWDGDALRLMILRGAKVPEIARAYGSSHWAARKALERFGIAVPRCGYNGSASARDPKGRWLPMKRTVASIPKRLPTEAAWEARSVAAEG